MAGVELAGIAFTTVPDIRRSDDRHGAVVGTLGGGAIHWQGPNRGSHRLEHQGMTHAEIPALLAALEAGTAVDLQVGDATESVVLLTVTSAPVLGTSLWQVRIDCAVAPVAPST